MAGHDQGGPSGGSGARGGILLVVAVGLGILILQAFDTGAVPFSDISSNTTAPRLDGPVVTTPSATTTTKAPRPPSELVVLAANGTGTSGLAGRVTEFLRTNGYTSVATPLDASRLLEASSVEFEAGYDAEAKILAQRLGLPATAVRQVGDAAPVPDRRGAVILVLIGPDLDRSLAGATPATARP